MISSSPLRALGYFALNFELFTPGEAHSVHVGAVFDRCSISISQCDGELALGIFSAAADMKSE